jgi:hypothetical protein
MGRDLEQFVHPERISSQLICPICTQVLSNPVQTPTEHLFCEDELLEWMTRSNLCPVTKTILDPLTIRKPSRIIVNMLSELEIYCNYKNKGCKWTGNNDSLPHHLEKECVFHQNALLHETIEFQNMKLQESYDKILSLELRNQGLFEENELMKAMVEDYQQRLRLFHALLPAESGLRSSNINRSLVNGGVSESSPTPNVIATEDDDDDDESGNYVYSDSFRENYRPRSESKLSPSSSSPSRNSNNSGGSRQASDVERINRLRDLKYFNPTLSTSLSEGKDGEMKSSRK